MSRKDGGIDLADRLLPPQVAERPCNSADWETASVCRDCMVELRGFEPMAIAAQAPVWGDGAAASVVEGPAESVLPDPA